MSSYTLNGVMRYLKTRLNGDFINGRGLAFSSVVTWKGSVSVVFKFLFQIKALAEIMLFLSPKQASRV